MLFMKFRCIQPYAKEKLRYWLLYEGDHLLAQKGNIQTFREFTVSTLSYEGNYSSRELPSV